MMTLRIRILFIILLVAVLAGIVALVRKRRLELKYVLLWMGSDLLLIVLMLFPQIITRLASLLGIYSPMNAVLFLGLLFTLAILFSMTVALSHATDEIRRLSQILALYSGADHDKTESDSAESDPMDS